MGHSCTKQEKKEEEQRQLNISQKVYQKVQSELKSETESVHSVLFRQNEPVDRPQTQEKFEATRYTQDVNSDGSPKKLQKLKTKGLLYSFINTDLHLEDDEHDDSFFDPPKYLEPDKKNLKFHQVITPKKMIRQSNRYSSNRTSSTQKINEHDQSFCSQISKTNSLTSQVNQKNSIQQYQWNLLKFQKKQILNPNQMKFKHNLKVIHCPQCGEIWLNSKHIFVECVYSKDIRQEFCELLDIEIDGLEQFLNNFDEHKYLSKLNYSQKENVIWKLQIIDVFFKNLIELYKKAKRERDLTFSNQQDFEETHF